MNSDAGDLFLGARAMERYRQLVVGRSMRSTVYTGKMSSCRFSSRPSFPRTEKIVGSPTKAFTSEVLFGGGGGSRMINSNDDSGAVDRIAKAIAREYHWPPSQ